MINRKDLTNSLEQDDLENTQKEDKQDLESLALEIKDKLETVEDLFELIDILKALFAVKGLIL